MSNDSRTACSFCAYILLLLFFFFFWLPTRRIGLAPIAWTRAVLSLSQRVNSKSLCLTCRTRAQTNRCEPPYSALRTVPFASPLTRRNPCVRGKPGEEGCARACVCVGEETAGWAEGGVCTMEGVSRCDFRTPHALFPGLFHPRPAGTGCRMWYSTTSSPSPSPAAKATATTTRLAMAKMSTLLGTCRTAGLWW